MTRNTQCWDGSLMKSRRISRQHHSRHGQPPQDRRVAQGRGLPTQLPCLKPKHPTCALRQPGFPEPQAQAAQVDPRGCKTLLLLTNCHSKSTGTGSAAGAAATTKQAKRTPNTQQTTKSGRSHPKKKPFLCVSVVRGQGGWRRQGGGGQRGGNRREW